MKTSTAPNIQERLNVTIMDTTTVSAQNERLNVTNDTSPSTILDGFSDLEGILICSNVILISLLILQSICFLVYVFKGRSRQRESKKTIISKKELRDRNETVRYSTQPLRHRSNPEIYESLKDLIDDPPPPPSIDTLPRKKVTPFKMQLPTTNDDCNDNTLTNPAERPRYPLPDEIDAPPLLPKNSEFSTLPTRTPQFRRLKPNTMQTLPSRQRSPLLTQYRGLNSPTFTQKPILIPPPVQSGYRSPATDSRSIPRSLDFQNNRFPPEPNLLPSPQKEFPMQQPNTRPQQQIIKPSIDNELMMKLKKRAALIPESSNSRNEQTNDNSILNQPTNFQLHTPKSIKPLPPAPPPRDSDYGWVDDFDKIVPLEPINLYNI